MKPIKLEIEGLHSFVEKQIIDFRELSASGVFGIFGQTGSGKSTILDAIILPNQTSQSSSTLWVN